MDTAVRPRRLMVILALVWAGMVILYGVTQYANVRLHIEDRRNVIKFFDLDGKANIPQTFQAMGLLAISFLSFGIARAKAGTGDTLTKYWKSLGWIFLFLSFDGICSIHNQLHVFSSKTVEARREQGVFYFSWVLAYGAIMLPVGLWFLRFLLKLPRALAIEIVIAGTIYVAGAMGMEMVYGWFRSHYGQVRPSTIIILTTLEESLETLGEMLMLHTLLTLMAQQKIVVKIAAAMDAASEQIVPTLTPLRV